MLNAEEIKAKYWALEVLSSSNQSDIANLSGSLETSKIDLNPHQIEAALFALNSPVSQGVILADEVGLGKTIEAGLVISEYFSRGWTSIIVVAPASLCAQWQVEMQEKFDLPAQIIDSKLYQSALKEEKNLFDFKGISICSYNCVLQLKKQMKDKEWHLVVIDEAHKLRNFYTGKTQIAECINQTFKNKKKLLLTATPIQNTLMDIFSLVSIIDTSILGNEYSFMENYLYSEQRHQELKKRLQCVLHRTLRKDVLEYIKYTNREAMTVAFNPTPAEEELYHEVSKYIQDVSQIAITSRVRTLIVLMIRKLMSSSTSAVLGTLEGLMDRLTLIERTHGTYDDLTSFFKDDDILREYRDVLDNYDATKKTSKKTTIIQQDIASEKVYLQHLINKAKKIKVDGKTEKLIEALNQGFDKIQAKGGQRKAIIFTESNRTLNYLFNYLSKNGFKDKIVTFNGQNNSPLCNQIYSDFIENHSSDLTGSRTNDMKKALVNAFKENAEIMIATEAAAEGLNLQFCSLLVNYDLPWNPQRVEQRIGRVHRYGQKSDVVIINFINKKNVADVRLYDILQHKFKLFDGVFGASDEILGTLSDGMDFEKAVASIFELCRTTEEINRAFDELQERLGVQREEKLEEAKQLVLENLTPTTQEKLHLRQQQVEDYLERRKKIFWDLTVIMLKKNHPDMFINEDAKQFGPYEDQVFDKVNLDINYGCNFNFALNFNNREQEIPKYMLLPRERKALKYRANPYNPDTVYGKKILEEALDCTQNNVHLVLNPTENLSLGQKGRLKLSLYKMQTPEIKYQLIATVIGETGGLLKVPASEIFDNIKEIQESSSIGYKDYLSQVQEQNIKKYEKSQQKRIDMLLKEEVDKLNRWLIDEKQAIHLKGEKAKNKITSLKRQFKMEKDFEAKLRLKAKIKELETQMNANEFNTFDTERELEKKCNRLIGGKKRSLKLVHSVEDVFDFSWSVG